MEKKRIIHRRHIIHRGYSYWDRLDSLMKRSGFKDRSCVSRTYLIEMKSSKPLFSEVIRIVRNCKFLRKIFVVFSHILRATVPCTIVCIFIFPLKERPADREKFTAQPATLCVSVISSRVMVTPDNKTNVFFSTATERKRQTERGGEGGRGRREKKEEKGGKKVWKSKTVDVTRRAF